MDIRKLVVTFTGEGNRMLAQHRMVGLPIRERQLVERSIELFHDPEPCMIHRSAVTQRIYEEFLSFVSSRIPEQGGAVEWNEIPSRIACCIDLTEPLEVLKVWIQTVDGIPEQMPARKPRS